MLNFTVGPVQMDEEILKLGSNEVPYFRTSEFSSVMLQNEQLMLEFVDAPKASRLITLTGSGTSGMESSILNLFNENDKLLIVNGGSFGHRFCTICDILAIPYTSIDIEFGQTLQKAELDKYYDKGYTGFVVNLHETSSGVLYDIDMISDFCKQNDIFLLVDAISCFLGEKISMKNSGINAMFTGSQKALALPPGLCLVVLDDKAIERVNKNKAKSVYFDYKDYLKNGERGQTPFTPAVSVILQLNYRLNKIKNNGGVGKEIAHTKAMAEYFRSLIIGLPFENFAVSPSNCVTTLKCKNGVSAVNLFEQLKNNYGIFICPNGGEYKDTIFRVGHIGKLEKKDYDILVENIKKVIGY